VSALYNVAPTYCFPVGRPRYVILQFLFLFFVLNYSNLKFFKLKNTDFKIIQIRKNVQNWKLFKLTKVSDSKFENCSNLKNVKIKKKSKNVQTKNCSNLKKLNFYNCSNPEIVENRILFKLKKFKFQIQILFKLKKCLIWILFKL
jgi:hypothetical protein